MQDRELLELSARGRRDAFESFMRRYYGPVVSYFSRSNEAAEDLAQEVFLRAFRNAGQFRGSGSAAGWLFSIATHLLIDERRRRKPLPQPPLTVSPPQTDPQVFDEAMNELNEDDRRLLWLKFVEDMSFSEVGEALGAPPTTLKYRAGRALRALAAALRRRGYFLEQEQHELPGISRSSPRPAGR